MRNSTFTDTLPTLDYFNLFSSMTVTKKQRIVWTS